MSVIKVQVQDVKLYEALSDPGESRVPHRGMVGLPPWVHRGRGATFDFGVGGRHVDGLQDGDSRGARRGPGSDTERRQVGRAVATLGGSYASSPVVGGQVS